MWNIINLKIVVPKSIREPKFSAITSKFFFKEALSIQKLSKKIKFGLIIKKKKKKKK